MHLNFRNQQLKIISHTHTHTYIHTDTHKCRLLYIKCKVITNQKPIKIHTHTHTHTHKERKDLKHNTKDSHQVPREESKRKKESKELKNNF